MIQAHPSGGYILEELAIGMAAEKRVTVTEQRISRFAEASDDFNPVHMDDSFAAKTASRGRIAHGLLSASFGSAVVGTTRSSAGSRSPRSTRPARGSCCAARPSSATIWSWTATPRSAFPAAGDRRKADLRLASPPPRRCLERSRRLAPVLAQHPFRWPWFYFL